MKEPKINIRALELYRTFYLTYGTIEPQKFFNCAIADCTIQEVLSDMLFNRLSFTHLDAILSVFFQGLLKKRNLQAKLREWIYECEELNEQEDNK